MLSVYDKNAFRFTFLAAEFESPVFLSLLEPRLTRPCSWRFPSPKNRDYYMYKDPKLFFFGGTEVLANSVGPDQTASYIVCPGISNQ